jgi:hypothetical protein
MSFRPIYCSLISTDSRNQKYVKLFLAPPKVALKKEINVYEAAIFKTQKRGAVEIDFFKLQAKEKYCLKF